MTQFPLWGFGPLERPGGKGQAAVFPLAGDRGALSRQHEEWAGCAARGALAASKEVGVEGEELPAPGCGLSRCHHRGPGPRGRQSGARAGRQVEVDFGAQDAVKLGDTERVGLP